MSATTPHRSASGARQGGDDYQHLVAWNRILRALMPSRQLESVALEALDAGNVDDVVIRYTDRPSEFAQVRYAVDGSSPLNSAYLTRLAAPRGTSMLQKFHASWIALQRDEAPTLMLITNRLADPGDPAFSTLDGRTELLAPALLQATPSSSLGKLLAEWTSHLGCTDVKLAELLSAIRFRVGRPYRAEEEWAADLMTAAGLRSDPSSIRLGIDRVRRWVLDGHRSLTRDAASAGIEDLGLGVQDPAAVLHVQTLLRDPTAGEATEALDWVDLYVGETPAERRATISKDAYEKVMQPQLDAAADRLLAAGHRRVMVRGAMRLPTQFAVGAALPKVRNVELVRRQGPDLWATDVPSGPRLQLEEDSVELSQGSDIAVVLGVTNDPTEDVLTFARANGLPVAKVLILRPLGGPADDAVHGTGHAIAIVQAARDATRRALRGQPGATVHLFLACPGALAMLLGHRWNRIAPTVLYEDLKTTYQAAFIVAA